LVIFSGVSRTDTIVSHVVLDSFASPQRFSGELLEKASRVLTAEEQTVLDQEWVGKDGSKRKLEVCARRDGVSCPTKS